MMQLLTIEEATFLVLAWTESHSNFLDPEWKKEVLANKRNEFFVFQAYIKNAIDAGMLPAMEKQKSKREHNKMMAAANVPDSARDFIPRERELWVTLNDVKLFYERGSELDENSGNYSHSRKSLAQAAWLLTEYSEVKDILNTLQDAATYAEEEGLTPPKERTLNGCASEIAKAGELMRK